MFEAQAALDLFLAEMRRREDASDDYIASWRARAPDDKTSAPSRCRYGGCSHYPPLELTGYPVVHPPPPRLACNAQLPLILSRAELLAHIARRGARTDRFDDQLIHLTSGANITDLYSNGRAGGAPDDAEVVRTGPQLWNSDSESCTSGAIMLSNGIDVAIPAKASVASLLGLAR